MRYCNRLFGCNTLLLRQSGNQIMVAINKFQLQPMNWLWIYCNKSFRNHWQPIFFVAKLFYYNQFMPIATNFLVARNRIWCSAIYYHSYCPSTPSYFGFGLNLSCYRCLKCSIPIRWNMVGSLIFSSTLGDGIWQYYKKPGKNYFTVPVKAVHWYEA